MNVTFTIFRQQGQSTPIPQSYHLDVDPQTTILDCLNRIKWEQDGSLAHRKNCRNAICGSCALRINNRPFLACKESIQSIFDWLDASGQGHQQELCLQPLGNLPVLKDLVVDMTAFWDDLDAIQPYLLRSKATATVGESLQSPQERQALTQTANCILCAACYSDCDAKGKNKNFVGPHALAKVQRFILDSRDQGTAPRLQHQSQGTQGVWGCNGCKMCNISCPMGVAPLSQIESLKIGIFDLLDPL